MKKLLIIAVCIVLAGCAEKTHVLDSTKSQKETKSTTDSTSNKNVVTTDRSVTTIERSADTTLEISGKPVTGEINVKDVNDSGVVSQHIENGDIDLDLSYNKNTGKATAKATPKTKKIPVNIHEKTTTNNDIKKTDNTKSSFNGKLETKSDTTDTHENDHKDPSVGVRSFKTAIIWTLVVIAVLAMLFFAFKKNFFRKQTD